MTAIRACVFDAYGTLFDVAGPARLAAAAEGGALAQAWPRLAEDWRARQLSYSWLRTITGHHVDFWQLTQDALDWALEAQGLAGDAGLRARLLALYRTLPAYPEVPATLAKLRERGFATAILSNGAPGMLADATASAGIETLIDAALSVEEVGVFKPADAVYGLVARQFGTAPSEVLFVSSNGWDAAAAADYGFVTVWVNRAGLPPDRLPGTPALVLSDLGALPDLPELQ